MHWTDTLHAFAFLLSCHRWARGELVKNDFYLLETFKFSKLRQWSLFWLFSVWTVNSKELKANFRTLLSAGISTLYAFFDVVNFYRIFANSPNTISSFRRILLSWKLESKNYNASAAKFLSVGGKCVTTIYWFQSNTQKKSIINNVPITNFKMDYTMYGCKVHVIFFFIQSIWDNFCDALKTNV